MSLRAEVRVAVGDFTLDVGIEAPAGEVTVVVGPNGAGKTTLLRVIAGTLAVDAGSVTLDGRVLDAPPRTFVPPEQRRMGVVHQDHLLFAHLNALDNVAFGPRCSGASLGEARVLARAWLERLGVGEQSSLRPAALSGGQAQRVALARALASSPAVLLLDEPLAALDATTRSDVRRDLRAHLNGFAGPTVLVTHDPVDALTLADRVVVIEDGLVTQSGTLAEVSSRPRSRYLADLVGVNLLDGVADGIVVHTVDRGVAVQLAASPLPGGSPGPVTISFPPSAVRLTPAPGDAPTVVRWLEVLGARVRVHVVGGVELVAELSPGEVAALGLAEGVAVNVSVDSAQVTVVPR